MTNGNLSQAIHQKIVIDASVQQIYDALTVAAKFAEFTGVPAEINLSPGGLFSCFGGMITGQIIEAVPNSRLVQAWRVSDWETGIYSIVKFELKKLNDTETVVLFDHRGFPDGQRDHLDQGWHDKYWNPLKKCLNS